jgi:hypothetical protein
MAKKDDTFVKITNQMVYEELKNLSKQVLDFKSDFSTFKENVMTKDNCQVMRENQYSKGKDKVSIIVAGSALVVSIISLFAKFFGK